MSIGEKVQALITSKGWSLEEVAARVRAAGATNVKYQHIQQLLEFPNRKPRYLLELAAAFGMTGEEVMAWTPAGAEAHESEQARSHLRPIVPWESADDLPEAHYVVVPRIMIKFSAGNGGPRWQPDPDPAQGQAFRTSFIRKERLRKESLMSAYAAGDSMEPRIQDGDSLLIDTSKTEVRDGCVYAIAWDEELRAKRLFRTPSGGVLIRSDNREKYPEFELKPENLGGLTIIGQVIHVSGRV